MKKGLIIYKHYSDDLSGVGVDIKRLDQKAAFENLGYNMDSVYLSSEGIVMNGDLIHNKNLKHKLKKQFYAHFRFYLDLKDIIAFDSYDWIYIRYGLSGRGFIGFLQHIKLVAPRVKVVIEFPTFPYENEYDGIPGRIMILRDRYFRRRLKNYVDLGVDFGDKKSILDIPCVSIYNGINLNRYPVHDSDIKKRKLRLIAIGKLWKWFGLDRIIEGMASYFMSGGNHDITLKIIGEGPEERQLKRLVDSKNLKDRIRFYGTATGQELDDLFNCSDIGVGTLAIHRKHVKLSSSLKHREYFVRRIPFIYAGEDPAFTQVEKGILRVDDTEREINMEWLIDHLPRLTSNIQISSSDQLQIFSWEHQLGKVIEKINQINKGFIH